MKKTTTLAVAAGLACTASAIAENPQVREAKPAQLAGYVYINVATGERVITPFQTADLSDPVFINNDNDSNGNFFVGLSLGVDPSDPTLTEEALDWGDLEQAADADCFVYAYATNVPPDTFIDNDGDGCPDDVPTATGFNSVNIFYNNTTGGGVRGTAAMNADGTEGFLVEDLPGGAESDGLFCGWLITIDFAGSDADPMSLGDTDADGDGKLDIGWSATFQDPTQAGTTGPFLVLPPGAYDACPSGTPNDLCIQDAFDTYSLSDGTLLGTWFFGGYICQTIPDATFPPFASLYTEIYGAAGGGPPECFADCNEDGELSILDFVCFQTEFSGGNLDKADCNDDGELSILDFVCFQTEFSAGCP